MSCERGFREQARLTSRESQVDQGGEWVLSNIYPFQSVQSSSRPRSWVLKLMLGSEYSSEIQQAKASNKRKKGEKRKVRGSGGKKIPLQTRSEVPVFYLRDPRLPEVVSAGSVPTSF